MSKTFGIILYNPSLVREKRSVKNDSSGLNPYLLTAGSCRGANGINHPHGRKAVVKAGKGGDRHTLLNRVAPGGKQLERRWQFHVQIALAAKGFSHIT